MSNLFLAFSRYYWHKNIWFLNICWRFICLANRVRRRGDLSSELIYSILMNGSSINWVLITFKSFIDRSEPDRLVKKRVTFSFRFTNLCLCKLKNYALIAARVVSCMGYPISLSMIINILLSCSDTVPFSMAKYTFYHWIISISAWIKRLNFWKKGFRSCIIL